MSKRRTQLVILAGCAAIAAGCGDDRDLQTVTDAERSAALELVDQTRALAGLTDDPTNTAALLASLRFDAVATLLAPNRAASPWTAAAPTGGTLLDCVTATTTTATFSGCEIDGHWVDGTVSRAGPSVNAEIVDVFILEAGSQGATSIDGAVVMAPHSIDGTLGFDANWRQRDRDMTLAAKVSFESVALDDTGCPVSGTVTVSGSLASPARESVRSLQFGPTCGDVLVGR